MAILFDDPSVLFDDPDYSFDGEFVGVVKTQPNVMVALEESTGTKGGYLVLGQHPAVGQGSDPPLYLDDREARARKRRLRLTAIALLLGDE